MIPNKFTPQSKKLALGFLKQLIDLKLLEVTDDKDFELILQNTNTREKDWQESVKAGKIICQYLYHDLIEGITSSVKLKSSFFWPRGGAGLDYLKKGLPGVYGLQEPLKYKVATVTIDKVTLSVGNKILHIAIPTEREERDHIFFREIEEIHSVMLTLDALAAKSGINKKAHVTWYDEYSASDTIYIICDEPTFSKFKDLMFAAAKISYDEIIKLGGGNEETTSDPETIWDLFFKTSAIKELEKNFKIK